MMLHHHVSAHNYWKMGNKIMIKQQNLKNIVRQIVMPIFGQRCVMDPITISTKGYLSIGVYSGVEGIQIRRGKDNRREKKVLTKILEQFPPFQTP